MEQVILQYNIKNSVPYDLTALVNGLPIPTTYAPNAPLTDPTKGIATLTVMDANGNIVRDANNNVLDAVTMFQHPDPTVTYFRPVFTVVPGFATAANYQYLIWWEVPMNGALLRDSEFGTTNIKSNNPFEKNPPA